MSNAMHLRELAVSDLPGLARLMDQLSEVASSYTGSQDLDHLRALYEEMARAPDTYYHRVMVEGDGLVGFVSAIFYRSFFHRGGTALINELVVEKSRRGQGIGRALVETVIQEARWRGMNEVEVATEKTNRAAQEFYRDAGFSEEYVLLGMEFA